MTKYDERDLLMQDFMTVETNFFPKNGGHHTPAHTFSDFKFSTFAPLAFRYFLNLFGVKREDFMVSSILQYDRGVYPQRPFTHKAPSFQCYSIFLDVNLQ